MDDLIEKYSERLQVLKDNRANTFDVNNDAENANYDNSITLIAEVVRDLKAKKIKDIVLFDENGKPILKGDKFSFTYLEDLNFPITLKGIFCWNQDELRYEIDVYNNDEYTCLSYVNNGVMYDFVKL